MPDARSLTTDPWFCLIQNVNRADRPPRLTQARPKSQGFMLRIAAILLVIGASLAAGPAAAQFGNIFGNPPPPRPPGDVPNGGFPAQPPPPDQYPGQQQYSPPPASAGPPPSSIQAQPLPPPPGATAAPPAQRARVSPPPANPRASQFAAVGQSAAPATRRYRSAVGRHGRHRDADGEDSERPSGLFRPRQDHRPHHFVRRGDRRNGAIRRAAGHRAGVLHAAADRGDEHRCLRRRRRGDAQGRDQAHLHRLDVRLKPGPACRRASDLRRLADRLLPTHPAAGAGRAIDDTISGSRGACAATPASASSPASSRSCTSAGALTPVTLPPSAPARCRRAPADRARARRNLPRRQAPRRAVCGKPAG